MFYAKTFGHHIQRVPPPRRPFHHRLPAAGLYMDGPVFVHRQGRPRKENAAHPKAVLGAKGNGSGQERWLSAAHQDYRSVCIDQQRSPTEGRDRKSILYRSIRRGRHQLTMDTFDQSRIHQRLFLGIANDQG